MASNFAGVIERKDENHKVTILPKTVGIYQSLLRVPLCVLNPKSAEKVNLLEVKWVKKNKKGDVLSYHKYQFRRDFATPFPTAAHMKYLDIMLSMFSQSWNSEGILYFRYIDILKAAGIENVPGSRRAIQQAIKRYRRHMTEWENCWTDRVDTLNFNIILASSILDEHGEIKTGKEACNPRNSKNKDFWHTVTFHPKLVAAMKEEGKNRILLTEMFSKLPTDAFCVYRYFYGFSDSSLLHYNPHMGWKSMDTLTSVFKWTGQIGRFKTWLNKKLDVLESFNLLTVREWNKQGTALRVICTNYRQIEPEEKVIESDTQGVFDINNCTDEVLVAQYIDYKEQGVIPSNECAAIDMMLSVPSMKQIALKGIKEAITNAHTPATEPGRIEGEGTLFS